MRFDVRATRVDKHIKSITTAWYRRISSAGTPTEFGDRNHGAVCTKLCVHLRKSVGSFDTECSQCITSEIKTKGLKHTAHCRDESNVRNVSIAVPTKTINGTQRKVVQLSKVLIIIGKE
jgi:hypothetical protein